METSASGSPSPGHGVTRAQDTRRPNFIVVLADDLGLSRVNCYGAQPFQTPHLDHLAATGVRFERCYSMPICGPSRSALLTGKYPFRTGATNNGNSEINPEVNPTLANVLRQAGYATCAIGKLGQSAPADDARAPQRLGFDESMLWMGRGTEDRYWKTRYYRNGEVVLGKPDEYGPDLTHAFLVDFMKRHREKPFFVYYSAVLTHGPFMRTPDSQDEQNLVRDMVAYLDKLMGRLVDDLQALGLRENTIILFTSDNGPIGQPLGTIRGKSMMGVKGEVAEGGVREPLIVNCPGLVPSAKVCADLTDFTDFFPTLLELAGTTKPEGLKLDGQSIAPQILGRPGAPRSWVYAQHAGEYFIADSRFKLYGNGQFVDITDSPVAEKEVAEADAGAADAKKRLQAALDQLRAGYTETPRLVAQTPAKAEDAARQLEADLGVLLKNKIIPAPDYWLQTAGRRQACDGERVAELLIRAASHFQPADNVAQAVDRLKKEGVINTPDYWNNNAKPGGRCNGGTVERLINKLAQRLRSPAGREKAGTSAAAFNVDTYPFPDTVPASKLCRVSVDGQPQFVHDTDAADFAAFAIRGPVTVTVEYAVPVTNAIVRPRARNIVPVIEGQTLKFMVAKPGPLDVEINGTWQSALLLFIDPPPVNPPPADAPGILRFAGGKVHDAGEIRLGDNQTLYLEPGAVVRGLVRADKARNIRVAGPGILDARPRAEKTHFLHFNQCTNVEMRDTIVLGSHGWTIVPWGCQDVRLANVKVFSWRDNDDGLDVCSSRDVLVEGCFFRTKDDCITLKALQTEYFPDPAQGSAPDADKSGIRTSARDVVNVRVERSVLWNAEWGNAMEIGFELRTAGVRGIVWRDCDILREERGAVFSIHNGDYAMVEDVRFENIRVEDARNNLVDFHVGLSIYSSDCPERYNRRNPKRKSAGTGPWVAAAVLTDEERALASQNRGGIRHVRFKDIYLSEGKVPPSLIINQGGTVEDVVFERIHLGQEVLSGIEALRLTVEGATGVRCLP